MQSVIQGLLLWGCLGLLLAAIGFPYTTWEFWCFIALFWATNKLSWESGAISGMLSYKNLTDKQKKFIDSLSKKLDEEDDRSN